VTIDDLGRFLGLLPAILENQVKLLDRLDRLAAATPAQAEPSMLTVREFAARAGLSQCTVRRRISDGSLSSTRIGASIRIPSATLQPVDPGTVARLAREARS
jgi:excisionase family DNA binding protein